ncbi:MULTISPECIES: hypothetical protein [Pseudomonas]|jgi:hypothetical protein|uniref:Uncharacterized protein n=2 Tax=Pseudomonas TaxID=286 RepID=A0A7X1GKB3_9PSED|nr:MULTISPECIES: hypothetical protein [Pseudomonas]MBC2693223.1 hypothetical protein [Pseudomonas kielensis]MDD1011077.1 hypothetical protein [Pseudomonas shahriarae]
MNKKLRDLLARVCAQLDVRAEYDPTFAGTEKPLNAEASLVNELRQMLAETNDPKHFDEEGKCILELVPALIAENEELKAKTATWCGYGDESLMHTFYGDAASIKALGEMIFELEGLRQDAKRPWWLRVLTFISGKTLGSPGAQTNTSGQAHCPHCAVCHTAEETCIQALRRVLALYERTEHGSGGAEPCA